MPLPMPPKTLVKTFTVTAFAISVSACSAISAASNTASSAADVVAVNEYTDSNMVAIKADAARGQGEHIDALAQLYGLEPEAADRFKAMVKAQYDVVFAGRQPQVMLQRMADASRS